MSTTKNNIFYAQSGGATAVINASACGVIQAAAKHANIGKVLAGHNGILGAIKEELIDTSLESRSAIAALRYTPSCAFGSCRYKLKSIQEDRHLYQRLLSVFQAHDIKYFFYNGGGDSQDTAYKVSQISRSMNYPLTCIGIPKTIDNDLPFTDNSPGFGSVAKYIAISTQEAACDIKSMCSTSTKVFILEVMGRHSGWIAAASGLGRKKPEDAPHIILFPEIPFDKSTFLHAVEQTIKKYNYCVIVASEGIKDSNGDFLTKSTNHDAFGHTQLGGVAPILAHYINEKLSYKYHWAVADYLQRAARHIASKTDVEQAYQLGKAAVEYAIAGKTDIMLTIERKSHCLNEPYEFAIGTANLADVANTEYLLPRHYISEDGLSITAQCYNYLAPLIQGEDYPPYKNGMPQYIHLQNKLVKKKLSPLANIHELLS